MASGISIKALRARLRRLAQGDIVASESRYVVVVVDTAMFVLVTVPHLQFAFLQLGTILATFVRKVEMCIEKRVPKHNYHVCDVFTSFMIPSS